jgi:hypothetical protein
MGNHNHALVLCLALAVLCVTLLAVLHTRSQVVMPQGERQAKQVKQPEDVYTSRFPIADFGAAKPTDPIVRAKREIKSKKYNRSHAPRISESLDNMFSTPDWEVRLPALPVARSSVVVIGEINDAQAHLSEDETAIYSEFEVGIHEVLKNDSSLFLGPGTSLTVERPGGRVRFRSGKIAVSAINHQDMPRVGRKYVLFLTNDFLFGGRFADTLFILTGYELCNSVFPLDKPVPGHPITAYTGVDENSFLQDLSSALNVSSLQAK